MSEYVINKDQPGPIYNLIAVSVSMATPDVHLGILLSGGMNRSSSNLEI